MFVLTHFNLEAISTQAWASMVTIKPKRSSYTEHQTALLQVTAETMSNENKKRRR